MNRENPLEVDPRQDERKKKQKATITLKSSHFEQRNGLRKLYEVSQKLNLDKGEFRVDESMRKIAGALKCWQFEFMPKYSYDYFLQRCQVLGSNK